MSASGVNLAGSYAPISLSTVYVYIATDRGVVVNGPTDNASLTANTAATNALLTLARTNKVPIFFPKGSVHVNGILDFRGDGLVTIGASDYGTIFVQHATNIVTCQIGYTSQTIRDIQVQYAAAPAGTDTSAIAFQVFKAFKGFYKLRCFQVGIGFALFQGDVNTPLGDNGGNYCFSNDIELTVQNYSVTSLDTTPFNAANTGNRWGNLYLQNPNSISPSGYGVKLVNNDNDTFVQLNIEGGTWGAANGPMFHQGSNTAVLALHLEGFSLGTYGKSVITADGPGCLTVNSLTMQGATVTGNSGTGDNKALVSMTGGANVVIDGLKLGNTNVLGSGYTFAMLDAADGTGKFWARGVDTTTLTRFTAISINDTGASTVCKQVNEQAHPAIASATIQTALGNLVLGTAFHNTLAYDVQMTVLMNFTANTSAVVKLGVGPTNTPTQTTIVTGVTSTGFLPVSFRIPAGNWALLSVTGTATETIAGQYLEAA